MTLVQILPSPCMSVRLIPCNNFSIENWISNHIERYSYGTGTILSIVWSRNVSDILIIEDVLQGRQHQRQCILIVIRKNCMGALHSLSKLDIYHFTSILKALLNCTLFNATHHTTFLMTGIWMGHVLFELNMFSLSANSILGPFSGWWLNQQDFWISMQIN